MTRLREYGSRHNLPYVILRPGYVFGPGKRELNARVGIDTFGFFIQVSGSNPLPLTFVDNCADAIVLAGLKPAIEGEIFNVVDDDLPTGRQFLRSYKNLVNPLRCIRIPYSLAYVMCIFWEKYSKWSKKQLPPVFNRRRCAAQWKEMRYSNQKLKDRLGWKPRVPMEEAIEKFLRQFASNGNDDSLKV
jgi:nucleoside-diphosphate-sugar epimerase